MTGKLIFEDNTKFEGKIYGAANSTAGEVVFSTGMMGYPESLTDPSYKGQILILTYPLIGNYGVPDSSFWESKNIMVSGLVVSSYVDTPSHFQTKHTLAKWFENEGIPIFEFPDTRLLTQKIRTKGATLGKIIVKNDIKFYDPNLVNLVEDVSTKTILRPAVLKKNAPTLLLIDCGAKQNIVRALNKRGVNVYVVPWDYNPFDSLRAGPFDLNEIKFDGLLVSNGPGDPKMATKTIKTIEKAMAEKIPILGICLGHQLLTLAAGGDTKKLKYGHRSQNQPCIMEGTKRCYITTQNHGFATSIIPKGFKPWFTNANDLTNEGIIHEKLPFMSVQFHPEATPGPMDAEWIFDYFLERIKKYD